VEGYGGVRNIWSANWVGDIWMSDGGMNVQKPNRREGLEADEAGTGLKTVTNPASTITTTIPVVTANFKHFWNHRSI
jgi:hypothetical protein